MASAISTGIGRTLAGFLSKSLSGYRRIDTVDVRDIAKVLRPGDVVLVEGSTRISVAIKYLTQSSWSHACLYVGDPGSDSSEPTLLEADLQEGVRLVSLEHYRDNNLRICRPNGLSDSDRQSMIDFAEAKIGHKYDLKNVIDLLRYLIQRPAVPQRYRRAMIAFGSGEPTKAICSTLIAESFQSIGYPILPLRDENGNAEIDEEDVGKGGEVPVFYRRHFTHFTPRDFDLSPYFHVIKPTLEQGFDYRGLEWDESPVESSDNSQ